MMRNRWLVLIALAVLLGAGQSASAQAAWNRAAAAELLQVVEQVGREGLDPRDYDAAALQAALNTPDAAALSARATQVFDHLAADFTRGHVQNRRAGAWHIQGSISRPQDSSRLMTAALSGAGVRKTLEGLLPQHRQYRALRNALAATPARDKAGVQRLRANLERWRWMPRDLGRKYLLVNVPAFTVSLVENNKVIARRRVIVGKTATPTPQFSATVTGVILNPWWEIPTSIVRESVGRLVASQPAQARARGYVVSRGRYRQAPGPGNALGQVKLVMPNPFTVYLHDTPSKSLFDRDIRAFSHGCIRVQDAFGLAQDLLAPNDGWSRARIDAVVAGGKTTMISLAEPLPVYVAYFTAAAEEDGAIATFPDVYGRDAPVVAGLTDLEKDGGIP